MDDIVQTLGITDYKTLEGHNNRGCAYLEMLENDFDIAQEPVKSGVKEMSGDAWMELLGCGVGQNSRVLQRRLFQGGEQTEMDDAQNQAEMRAYAPSLVTPTTTSSDMKTEHASKMRVCRFISHALRAHAGPIGGKPHRAACAEAA